jgi:hypothetical protein
MIGRSPRRGGCRVSERVEIFSPGEEVVIALGFEYEGDREIESVEAVFVREGPGREIVFLGDARSEASGGGRVVHYAARLGARIAPDVAAGEYRCARLSARDRFDDDWGFTDPAGLDLLIRVEPAPHRLEVTASDFI